MTVINQVGNALTGSTGSGSFAGSTSPILVTPTLGVASATSINFGGSALNTYEETGSWTPTFTFVNVGDLSVAYSNQTGKYTRIGNQVTVICRLGWTPTFTTSTGNAKIGGLPYSPYTTGSIEWFSSTLDKSAFAFPAGTTSIAMVNLSGISTSLYFIGSGTATASAVFTTTQFPTTVAQLAYFSMTYLV